MGTWKLKQESTTVAYQNGGTFDFPSAWKHQNGKLAIG